MNNNNKEKYDKLIEKIEEIKNDIIMIHHHLTLPYNRDLIINYGSIKEVEKYVLNYNKDELVKYIKSLKPQDLHSMTLSQLRDKAKELRIYNYSRKNSFELICDIQDVLNNQ